MGTTAKLHAANSLLPQASVEAMSPSATNSAPPTLATGQHDVSDMQALCRAELAELKKKYFLQHQQQQYLLEQLDKQQLELKCLRPQAKRAEALESENERLQAEVKDLSLQIVTAQSLREKSIVARFEEELKHQHWMLQKQQRELEQHKCTEAQLRETQVQLRE